MSDPVGDDPHAQLSAIGQGSDDAIVVTRLDGIVIAWNRGAEVLYGYAATEMLGKSVARLYPEHEGARVRRSLERIQRGQPDDVVRGQRWRADGELLEVEVQFSPIFDQAGTIVGTSSIARDIGDIQPAPRTRRADGDG